MASNKQDTIKMVLQFVKTPSKRRVAEILKNGTPRERAWLYFCHYDTRYRPNERDMQLLTPKQETKLLESYPEGSQEENEMYTYLNNLHSIKILLKEFVSWCRLYKENLLRFTNYYNIFFDYWHECSTMQKTLDCITQLKELPFKAESELNHKEILDPLYGCLKDSYTKIKLPYATIKMNQFGQLYVDMTGEKGSLYIELAEAAKTCTITQAQAKGAIIALEEFATENDLLDFIPSPIYYNVHNVKNGFNPDEDCYKEMFMNHTEEEIESIFNEMNYKAEYKDTFKDFNKYLGMLSTYEDIVPEEKFYNLTKTRLNERRK